MSRRDFVKATGTGAAGGAAFLLGAQSPMRAAPADEKQALKDWGAPWRPACPLRLSDRTRALAHRALSGEHGQGLIEAQAKLDRNRAEGLSADMRYALAAMTVAETAPLRMLPGELVVGSASLIEGARHATPVSGDPSTSHTTIGFARGLAEGYDGIRKRIRARLDRGGLDPRQTDFLRAMEMCLDAADVWTKRQIAELREQARTGPEADRAGRLKLASILERVPNSPPRTFHEAVQALWSMWSFQRLMGNWSGIGRIDEMLGPYLKADLAAKRVTLDEAREILAHFWIKGCEWLGVPGAGGGSGDAQFYQNIILAGVGADGKEVANDVTYLVLDIVEELHISDFPIAVRLNRSSPDKLLRRVAEVQRHGGGIVALYNEEKVIAGLQRMGFSLPEARGFANDGCWEVLIPGKTTFSYAPFDILAHLQGVIGSGVGGTTPDYAGFDDLYAAFAASVGRHVKSHHAACDQWCTSGPPSPLLSLLVDDCIERARGYYERGSRYYVLAPHAGGMADVANSLLVIKDLVYDRKLLSLGDFAGILRGNWAGHEHLRRRIGRAFELYGNDSEAADAMMCRVFNDYTAMVAEVPQRNGVMRPAGLSTFGRQIEYAPSRSATASGAMAGTYLASNCSPSPGTDLHGPTAVLRSYCKLDFERSPSGATLELKVHPETVKGEKGVSAMVALMRAFVHLGGWYLHVDVMDSALLADAQAHPDKYPNLSVRIAGWSARFATLSKPWQDMLIERTQQYVA
jgi:formate C-acetyltransferase